jgi:hypothetical protein
VAPYEGRFARQPPAIRRISAARSDAQTRQQRGQPTGQDIGPLSCEELEGRITAPGRSAFQDAVLIAVGNPTAFEERAN